MYRPVRLASAAASRFARMGEAHILLCRLPVGSFFLQWLAALLVVGGFARSARADEARAAVRAALEQEASAPASLPLLPSLAAERAGKRGEALPPGRSDASRVAREQGEARAEAAARSEAAARAARGEAASAAKSANADEHAAAGQARTNAARKKPHGPGNVPAVPPGTSR